MESKQLQKINKDFKKILKPQRNKNELNKSIWEKERKKNIIQIWMPVKHKENEERKRRNK